MWALSSGRCQPASTCTTLGPACLSPGSLKSEMGAVPLTSQGVTRLKQDCNCRPAMEHTAGVHGMSVCVLGGGTLPQQREETHMALVPRCVCVCHSHRSSGDTHGPACVIHLSLLVSSSASRARVALWGSGCGRPGAPTDMCMGR